MASEKHKEASRTSDGGSLYSLLNVPKAATTADLKAAYRRMSQLYHPDKHQDPKKKEVATASFTRIKEAYEILSDVKLRKIYDEFGLEAVRKASGPGMEMVPYNDLRQRFQEEENDGKGAGQFDEGGRADPRFKMVNSVQAQVDATGLAVALEYGLDAVQEYGIPMAVLTQTMLSNRASVYVTNQDLIEVNYYLATNHGDGSGVKSMGRLTATGRHQFSSEMYAEAGMDFSRGALLGKVYRSLSDDMSAAIEMAHALDGEDTTMAVTAERSLSSRNYASIRWAAGSQPAVTFAIMRRSYNQMLGSEKEATAESDTEETVNGFAGSHVQYDVEPTKRPFMPIYVVRESLQYIVSENLWQPVGARCTFSLSPLGTSLSGSLKRPIGENAPWFGKSEPQMGGAHVGVRGTVSSGQIWSVEVEGGQKYFESDSFWTLAVSMGSTGVVLRLNLGRAGHTLSMPFVLSSPIADPKTATIAALSTSLFVAAVQSLLILPWQARLDAEERKAAKEARREAMAAAKDAAEASRKLMQKAIEASRQREEAVPSGGLLIVRALYGLRKPILAADLESDSFEGREIQCEVTEVGDCLQALVEESRVQIITSNKSTLMGFWDPTALGDDKMLRIWYRFRNVMHLCTIEEHEPLELPQAVHKL